MQSIIEPQTKPATEWIAGQRVQKVSPTARHANAQTRIAAALLAWADSTAAGRIGTEWEFRIAPAGELVRSLVPDVSYLSYEEIGIDDDRGARMPGVAPNVAIEILSPNDRRRNVEEKIRVYLACGTQLVIVADPELKEVNLYDSASASKLRSGETLQHTALPGFAIPVAAIFAKPGELSSSLPS